MSYLDVTRRPVGGSVANFVHNTFKYLYEDTWKHEQWQMEETKHLDSEGSVLD